MVRPGPARRRPKASSKTDSRDIMGGGPGFFRPGMPSGSSPIPRTTVNFDSNYAPGTIYINTAERRLYLVLGNGQAIRYGIGVGRDGFRWGGTHRISAKKEWPSWTPRPDAEAAAGSAAPYARRHRQSARRGRCIWDRALPHPRLQEPRRSDRRFVRFRMTNEDVTDLYSRVSVGTARREELSGSRIRAATRAKRLIVLARARRCCSVV